MNQHLTDLKMEMEMMESRISKRLGISRKTLHEVYDNIDKEIMYSVDEEFNNFAKIEDIKSLKK